MSDHAWGEDPSLASFGRHLRVGGVLGLGVGASWEVMSLLWTPGQFAPLRLLVWGLVAGLFCGFVTWISRSRNCQRRTGGTAPRGQSAQRAHVGLTWRSLSAHVAWGVIGGVASAPSYVAVYWIDNSGQRVFAIVGCIALGVAAGALVWLVRAGYADAKAARTSRGADPIGLGKHTGEPPAAFDRRLAAFLNCRPQELLHAPQPPRSIMPFWSIVESHSYCGPKPVWIIRRLLERIRATLRGTGPDE